MSDEPVPVAVKEAAKVMLQDLALGDESKLLERWNRHSTLHAALRALVNDP